MLLHCWRLYSDPLKFKNNEELHIFSNNNKDVIDIPNVTLASNEDERKHSEHDTPLQNNSNKLFIKPKHIFVAMQNNIEATDIPNVTLASNEDERKHSEHDTPLQNNKLSIKPKCILVATPNNKNIRNPSNDTDEDERKM